MCEPFKTVLFDLRIDDRRPCLNCRDSFSNGTVQYLVFNSPDCSGTGADASYTQSDWPARMCGKGLWSESQV
jgi:hypothetical protein